MKKIINNLADNVENFSRLTNSTVHAPDLREQLFFLFSGMAISVPFALVFNMLASQFAGQLFPTFFAMPAIVMMLGPFFEEFAKAYPLFYRHGESEKSIVHLGFLTGLGFGIVELLIYFFVFNASLPIRLAAAIFHAASTTIVSFGIAKKKTLFFYLLSVILHASINYAAIKDMPQYFAAVIILFSLALAIIFSRLARNEIIRH